jgi:hypothetical protein
VAVIEQDSADQETGEDEEEVDAAPRHHQKTEERRRRLDLADEVVPDQHEEDGQAAHAVELADAPGGGLGSAVTRAV